MLGYSEPPRLGQIKLCFTHTFCGQTRKFVLFSVFAEPQLDDQSRMWWIDGQKVQKANVMELPWLSFPLVVLLFSSIVCELLLLLHV